MDQVLADSGPVSAGAGPVGGPEAAMVPLADLVPVMLKAEEARDTVVTSQTYRQILVAFAEASGPLRCRDVCEAMGSATEARHVEGMRSKLKRLVDRGLLSEEEPGLFALTSRTVAP